MSQPSDVTALGIELYSSVAPLAEQDSSNGWALLHYSDALIAKAQQVADQASDDGDKPGWSILVDLDRCPGYGLDFLSQFAGADLSKLNRGVATDTQFEELKRFRIKELPSRKRGTLPSMIAAAQQYLIGNKSVIVQERPGGHPWRIVIITYTAETPNPKLVEEALLEMKPAGIKLEYSVIPGANWLLLRTEYTTWQQVKEAFKTWGGVRLNKPGE